MASLYSRPRMPARSLPILSRPTSSLTSKIRNSCRACASSKVKCSGQKPSCNRCARRKIDCHYDYAKRAGRKHQKPMRDSISTTDSVVAQPLSDSGWSTSNSESFEVECPTPPTHADTSEMHDIGCISPQTIAHCLLTNDPRPSSEVMYPNTGLDNLFNDSTPVPISCFPSTGISCQPESSLRDDCANSRNGFDFQSAANIAIPQGSGITFARYGFDVPNKSSSESSGACETFPGDEPRGPLRSFEGNASLCCLTRALGFLQQISPENSKSCRQHLEYNTSQMSTAQTVVMENEQIVNIIHEMLLCSCSQDGYILAIISLMMIEILNRYDAMSSRNVVTEISGWHSVMPYHSPYPFDPSSQAQGHTAFLEEYCNCRECSAQTIEHQLYSQLKPVQQVINQLLQKLKIFPAQYNAHIGSGTPGMRKDPRNRPLSSSSIALLNQLEVDLQERLDSLPSEILNMLRQG